MVTHGAMSGRGGGLQVHAWVSVRTLSMHGDKAPATLLPAPTTATGGMGVIGTQCGHS